MAKDYFQDIMPPSENPNSGAQEVPIRVNTVDADEEHATVRGIRNIPAPTRPRPAPHPIQTSMSDPGHEMPTRRPPSRLWIWAAAALGVLVLSVLTLLMFRPTTVTVIPKSHTILLTDTILFSASPRATATGAMLPYTVQSSDIEDSEVVPSQGVVRVERKASGSITVFNEYGSASVRLIKNTRFETPDGLIFRTPAEIVVPGKSGANPGQVRITVIADQAGEKYNVGPTARFTLPGLKSGDMYTKVYAKSTEAMTGGFVGDEPGTAPGALNNAIAAVRGRLEAKARETALTLVTPETIAFPDLVQITYQSLPNTQEAGTGLRIHERAHIEIPVFPAEAFASVVAQATAADSDNAPIRLVLGKDFAADAAATSSLNLGVDTVKFTLSGQAQLIWKVDAAALAEALAGRDSGAFQTIVNGFPGIQEAHARIEPFWKRTFPQASDIKITVEEPKMGL